MATANAIGIRVVPSTGGKLDYYRLLEGNGMLKQFQRHLVFRIIGVKYRRVKSSSLQSLERGRPTEIDYLNGCICGRAGTRGADPFESSDGGHDQIDRSWSEIYWNGQSG